MKFTYFPHKEVSTNVFEPKIFIGNFKSNIVLLQNISVNLVFLELKINISYSPLAKKVQYRKGNWFNKDLSILTVLIV